MNLLYSPYVTAKRLACPITVVYGANDTMFKVYSIGVSNAKSWQEFTGLPLDIKPVPGNHSYFMEPEGGRVIQDYLKKLLASKS